ncbi:restriction endonuclease subunit S [Chitinibacter bivalviorum]|uniref:Restriction endonuclease subunit S n=1 Tax=Chitinibacter bivalviorum TaxID=2739434 RepID=A0A7H9BIQ5_9NEIS|nr:restriction endonuclease subunit S [Chitinibacter bivalviorum]QLG88176.1 restriction endonuclease subunit S [Chitinibacter bivalviorum]
MKAGWSYKRFGEVATLQRGFDLPTQNRIAGTFPLVSSSGVIDSHHKSAVKSPGVITGRSGSIGKVFFIDKDYWPLNTVLYVKDFHGNDPKFIFHFLNNFDLKRFATGTGVPTLNRNFVHDERVLFTTDTKEQQRIVAILDEAFEGIATAKANAEKNLQNARALFESHLQYIFSNKDQNWRDLGTPLSELCELIVDCEHKTAPTQDEGIPSIRTPNIGKGKLLLDGVYRVSQETYVEWTRRAIPAAGDLILAREAPAGNVAVIPENQPLCLGQRTVLIRPKSEFLNSHFLAYFLLQPLMQTKLLAHSRGATVQHVNMKDIRALQLGAIPPVAKQAEIVELIQSVSQQNDQLISIYQQKLAALDELKKALLQQAFSGEL